MALENANKPRKLSSTKIQEIFELELALETGQISDDNITKLFVLYKVSFILI